MRTRPRSIALLSALFFLAPLVLFNILLVESHFNLSKLNHLWTWNYSALVIGCVVVAVSVWSVRPWGYFTCLFIVSCGVFASLIAYCKSPDMTGYFFLITTVIASALTIFLLQRHVSSPYFNPRQRWWETPTRYQAQFQVLASVEGAESPFQLIDISQSGCYIEKVAALRPGDLMHVRIAFLDVRLELMTKVVRQSQKPVEGVGLMFVDLTRADRKDLTLLLEHLQNHRAKPGDEKVSSVA